VANEGGNTPHTVLEFTFAEFDKNLVRTFLAFTSGSDRTVNYTATRTAQLIVVAEDRTGVKTTYWFKIPTGEVVLVSNGENLIYIPAKCSRKAPGDLTSCGRG
jgi:hypothetical protein